MSENVNSCLKFVYEFIVNYHCHNGNNKTIPIAYKTINLNC